jgi:hypothetical protein
VGVDGWGLGGKEKKKVKNRIIRRRWTLVSCKTLGVTLQTLANMSKSVVRKEYSVNVKAKLCIFTFVLSIPLCYFKV